MQEEATKKEQEKELSSFAKASADKLEELEKRCDEYLNNWKRSAADFINYKKEEMERMGLLASYAKEDMVLKVLPILDSFYLAEKQLPEKLKKGLEGTPQSIEWTKGFLQIKKQIQEFLKKEGIEEIEVMSKPFDPATMEIVEEVDNNDSGLKIQDSGTVVEELQKGYTIEDKIIRPAKVKVSK